MSAKKHILLNVVGIISIDTVLFMCCLGMGVSLLNPIVGMLFLWMNITMIFMAVCEK